MRVWRLIQARHEDQALSGEGAALHGGRWNPSGVPMVYAAQSAALAMLEVRVNLAGPPTHPYVALQIEVPDADVRALPVDLLPDGWAESPYRHETQALGFQWVTGFLKPESVGLVVPSAVLPLESTVLLNRRHLRFREAVTVVARHDVTLDRRLFGNAP